MWVCAHTRTHLCTYTHIATKQRGAMHIQIMAIHSGVPSLWCADGPGLLQLWIQTQFLFMRSSSLALLAVSDSTQVCARRRLTRLAWHKKSLSSMQWALPPCRTCKRYCHYCSYAPTLSPTHVLGVSVLSLTQPPSSCFRCKNMALNLSWILQDCTSSGK